VGAVWRTAPEQRAVLAATRQAGMQGWRSSRCGDANEKVNGRRGEGGGQCLGLIDWHLLRVGAALTQQARTLTSDISRRLGHVPRAPTAMVAQDEERFARPACECRDKTGLHGVIPDTRKQGLAGLARFGFRLHLGLWREYRRRSWTESRLASCLVPLGWVHASTSVRLRPCRGQGQNVQMSTWEPT
jgi:hypothetical protein